MTKSKIPNEPVNGPWSIVCGLLKKFKTIDYRPSTIGPVISFNICALCLFWILCFGICHFSFAQDGELEFNLDVDSNTISLPKIFKPNIDLSGRGFNPNATWPQGFASNEIINTWQRDIGFKGMYRIQYNLWEINQLAKDKELQNSLLSNYENIIKTITETGGIVILDIFGTPAGLGRALDKTSQPRDLRAYKELIKNTIRTLSCNKRYNIWYEVWSTPDLDTFFLGRKQEYLNLYRIVAEAIKELELERKIYIPLGGPSVSWWFQNFDGNSIITSERSLIYELIKFCYRNRLPLDFITWHGYSTDPGAEKEATIYNKTAIELIRDWLSYFHFDRNIPLIVDEWNYDRGTNLSPERKEKSFVCASYIPSRIKNMHEAGIDYQIYFSLEDFQNNKEGVVRNTGVFWFDPESLSEYKGDPKSIYNIFRMLTHLEENLFLSSSSLNDEFVGVLATRGKDKDNITILLYNYIDPDIAINFLSKNIARLNGSERKQVLNIIKSDRLEKILQGQLDIASLRVRKRVRTMLEKTKELNNKAAKFQSGTRNIKIGIKNLKENYTYQRYLVDSTCSIGCEFVPVEEKQIEASDIFQELLTVSPYSVNMISLKRKPKEPESAPPALNEQAPGQNVGNVTQ